MNEQSINRTNGRRRAARALALLAAAGVVTAGAAGVVATRPTTSGTSFGPGSSANAIGEHSALGAKRVDDLNSALAGMGRLRGEHAGLSRAEYEANAGLDGPVH